MGAGGIHHTVPDSTDCRLLLIGFQIDIAVILGLAEASSGIPGRCVSHDIAVVQFPLPDQAEVRCGTGGWIGLSVQPVGSGVTLDAVEHAVFRHHDDPGVIGIVVDIPVKEHQIPRFRRVFRCLLIEVHLLELIHAVGHQRIVRDRGLLDPRLIGAPGSIHGTPSAVGKSGTALPAGIQDRGIPLSEFRQIVGAFGIPQLCQGDLQNILILIPGIPVCILIRAQHRRAQHGEERRCDCQRMDAFFHGFHIDSSNVVSHRDSFYYNNFAILRQPRPGDPAVPNRQNV